jgi:predicted ATPase
MRRLLGVLARRSPVVLCLDDVHWADGASVELVASLTRRPLPTGVLLAVTFRPGRLPAALQAVLAAAVENGGTERMELGPLSDADAGRLLADFTPSRRQQIIRMACGNPLFLLQLARHPDLADAVSAVDEAPLDLGLPASVEASLLAELGHLGTT